MAKILQINVTANWGSHGKIAELIGRQILSNGWDSYIAYGQECNPSESQLIKIGNWFNVYSHLVGTRLTDKHGLFSTFATRKFITVLKTIKPDIIHLHNIHGYYINYKMLLQFASEKKIPVVVTLHDCWTFTGHCAHFVDVDCNKWQTGCYKCPKIRKYPKAFYDGSRYNYLLKKELWGGISNLTLVPVSEWLQNFLSQSILSHGNSICIHNGIDTSKFKPSDFSHCYNKYNIPKDKKIILGVASVWATHRGLNDILTLRSLMDDSYIFVLVGIPSKLKESLSLGVIGIARTNGVEELAALYSMADVYLNPTMLDTLPTTNIESLACGTPVVTYRTGGSSETIDEDTGIIVNQKDVQGLKNAIESIISKGKLYYTHNCRKRALEKFDMNKQYSDYIKLYKKILNETK